MTQQYFKDIFCIVGYERSGTTMLRGILYNSSEMNVHYIEPHYILEMYHIFGLKITNLTRAIDFLYNHRKYPRPGSELHKETKERLSLETLTSIYIGINEIHIGEFFLKFYHRLYSENIKGKLLIKHPEFALHMDILEQIFPGIKIINMIRDPRSAIASSFARWPSSSFTYRSKKWNNSISLPKKWAVKNPNHYLEVVYEKLLIDFKDNLNRICNFLEISMEDGMINFHYNQGQWSVNSEYKEKTFTGVDKSKVESWKKSLNSNQVILIEKACSGWMKEYGYVMSEEKVKNSSFIIRDKLKYFFEFARINVIHPLASKLFLNRLKYAGLWKNKA